jgi:hypothetical protein
VKQHITYDVPEDGRVSLKCAVLITTQLIGIGQCGNNHISIQTFMKFSLVGVEGNN